jgi:hypothetical protein
MRIESVFYRSIRIIIHGIGKSQDIFSNFIITKVITNIYSIRCISAQASQSGYRT